MTRVRKYSTRGGHQQQDGDSNVAQRLQIGKPPPMPTSHPGIASSKACATCAPRAGVGWSAATVQSTLEPKAVTDVRTTAHPSDPAVTTSAPIRAASLRPSTPRPSTAESMASARAPKPLLSSTVRSALATSEVSLAVTPSRSRLAAEAVDHALRRDQQRYRGEQAERTAADQEHPGQSDGLRPPPRDHQLIAGRNRVRRQPVRHGEHPFEGSVLAQATRSIELWVKAGDIAAATTQAALAELAELAAPGGTAGGGTWG